MRRGSTGLHFFPLFFFFFFFFFGCPVLSLLDAFLFLFRLYSIMVHSFFRFFFSVLTLELFDPSCSPYEQLSYFSCFRAFVGTLLPRIMSHCVKGFVSAYPHTPFPSTLLIIIIILCLFWISVCSFGMSL